MASQYQVSMAATNPGLPGYGQVPEMVGTPQRNSKSDWFLPESRAEGTLPIRGLPRACAHRPLGRASNLAVDYPGTSNANLSLFKEFSLNRLREGTHLEFRTEWFNALNHPQFAAPIQRPVTPLRPDEWPEQTRRARYKWP